MEQEFLDRIHPLHQLRRAQREMAQDKSFQEIDQDPSKEL
jgi:hypothetical protein